METSRKKRLFLVCLALLLLLTAGGAAAAGEEQGYGPYRYAVLEDGTAALRSYDGVAAALTIPETLNGIPVTALGDSGRSCYFFDDWLLSVTIPNTVLSVEPGCFLHCPALQEIIVAEDHPTLAVMDGVLVRKEDMELIACPAGRDVGDFQIPDGIRKIGDMAFYGCGKMTSVTIPASVTEMGVNPFYYVNGNFGEIRLAPDHPTLKLEGGVLIDTVKQLAVCADPASTQTELALPEGLTGIGPYAFAYHETLTHVSIPAGVKEIGEYAFSNCKALTDVTFPEGLETLGDSCFSSCGSLSAISLPQGLKTLGSDAFGFCKALPADLQIPDSVTTLGNAFYYASGPVNITIPAGVKRLESYTFYNCDTLQTLILPEGLEYIGKNILYETSVTELDIPDSVTEIGEEAFHYCKTLERVKLPAGLREINDSLFSGCRALEEVIMPEKLVRIGRDAFYNCNSLTGIDLPDSVETIEFQAFSGCRLESLRIPASLTYLGDRAVSCPLIVPEGSEFEYYCRYHHLQMLRP